jgi:hypothetical protein
MSASTVIWEKTWDGPVADAHHCEHDPAWVLTINQRLEAHGRKGRQIVLDGVFCMACGTEHTGRFTVAEALHLCMEQHGWNRKVGDRLYTLAEEHKAELIEAPAIPIWCFYAFGWTGREIHKALNSGKLNPARMSEEVEELAAKINPVRNAA